MGSVAVAGCASGTVRVRRTGGMPSLNVQAYPKGGRRANPQGVGGEGWLALPAKALGDSGGRVGARFLGCRRGAPLAAPRQDGKPLAIRWTSSPPGVAPDPTGRVGGGVNRRGGRGLLTAVSRVSRRTAAVSATDCPANGSPQAQTTQSAGLQQRPQPGNDSGWRKLVPRPGQPPISTAGRSVQQRQRPSAACGVQPP